ncbi:hypothetical protein GCM10009676_16290 [Prauserella halophila]|uniref:DUF2157 domain-containing protein n=1 Tax=Prauserella halophila TaxID=185641 RepID=A0ABN1W598_9PSEU|nr:hypothetical protein [Prauserella halophila]MCP2236165.1 hypothetical protein [Prauserella halophila]
MSEYEQRLKPVVRAIRWVGDLSNPLYSEERRRDVSNEAAAAGLQVILLLGLGAAGGSLWIAGGEALPYIWVFMAVLLVGLLTASCYAALLGVSSARNSPRVRHNRPRDVLALGLWLVLFSGYLRAIHPGELDLVTALAAILVAAFSLGVSLGLLVLWNRRIRRSSDRG